MPRDERDQVWLGAFRDVLVAYGNFAGNLEMPTVTHPDGSLNVKATLLLLLPVLGVDVSNVEP